MTIVLDGIDRTGKDTIHRYLEQLGNYKYEINVRGILTQLAYSEKFKRPYEYTLDQYKNEVIIFLYADIEDLEIRFKMTKEQSLNSKKKLKDGIIDDLELFSKYVNYLEEKGFTVLKYNTTYNTPYMIAKDIVEKLEENDYGQI